MVEVDTEGNIIQLTVFETENVPFTRKTEERGSATRFYSRQQKKSINSGFGWAENLVG